MNITHYGFAFFVFILLLCAIWFYARVTQTNKKGNKGGYEKEQQLFKLYQNIEDMLGGFEEYVEEAKADIDKRIMQAETVFAGSRPAQETKPAVSEAKAPPAEAQKPAAPEVKKPEAKKPAQEAIKKHALKTAGRPFAENAADHKEPKKSENSGAGKPKQKIEELIPQYIAKGMTKEEVAKALGISTKEVSLIMELKKMGTAGD